MKLTQLSLAALLSVVSIGAMAQAKAPEPDYTLSFNAAVTTDYRYRGISQSRLKPAISAGADFAHKSGIYVGVWGSSIKWIKDNGVSGSVELDLYGGYKGSFNDNVSYDVGVLHYAYAGNDLKATGIYANADTTEVYGAVTIGPVTAKYSKATGRLFGSKGTQGAGYFDLTANFDLGSGFTLSPHIGHQSVSKKAVAFYGTDLSYTDYSLTLAKDFGNGIVGTVAAVGTNADKVFYSSPATGKALGKGGVVVGVKYNF